jgi:hypothetical protein
LAACCALLSACATRVDSLHGAMVEGRLWTYVINAQPIGSQGVIYSTYTGQFATQSQAFASHEATETTIAVGREASRITVTAPEEFTSEANTLAHTVSLSLQGASDYIDGDPVHLTLSARQSHRPPVIPETRIKGEDGPWDMRFAFRTSDLLPPTFRADQTPSGIDTIADAMVHEYFHLETARARRGQYANRLIYPRTTHVILEEIAAYGFSACIALEQGRNASVYFLPNLNISTENGHYEAPFPDHVLSDLLDYIQRNEANYALHMSLWIQVFAEFSNGDIFIAPNTQAASRLQAFCEQTRIDPDASFEILTDFARDQTDATPLDWTSIGRLAPRPHRD